MCLDARAMPLAHSRPGSALNGAHIESDPEYLALVRATPAQRLAIYRTSAVCFGGGATVEGYVEQQQCAAKRGR